MIAGLLAKEALSSAKSQPVASAATLLVTVGMVLAVMLTTGRTVGAQEQVLGSIDAMGTRTLVIHADDGAGMSTDALTRLAPLEDIEWAAAFSSATDGVNSDLPGGEVVPTRFAYGPLWPLGIPDRTRLGTSSAAYVSAEALRDLGMSDPAGSITLTDKRVIDVAGLLEVPDFMQEFEPLVLVPAAMNGSETVNILVVVARTPAAVGPLTAAISALISPTDTSKVRIETSEALAHLRGLVEGQLSSLSAGVLLAVTSVTGLLLATIQLALVTLRRKDFGRRRALGATRSFILSLVLLQACLVATTGALLGMAIALCVSLATGDPLPGVAFITALIVTTIVVAATASFLPALVASRRDPVRELRVP
ncbi:MAG: lipoprotein ABC transporter permease [Protaetiibacter sp.]